MLTVLALLPFSGVVLADEPHELPTESTSMFSRLAARLDADEDDLFDALEERGALQRRSVSVGFQDDAGQTYLRPVTLSLADHPEWIVFNKRSHAFVADTRAIRHFLEREDEALIPNAIHAGIAYEDGREPILPKVQPRAGYEFNSFDAARAIADALNDGTTDVTVNVQYVQPRMYYVTASGTVQLSLLSRGESDFTGSPLGRAANVEKAVNDHLDGIVIAPGEEFSFNRMLADTSGWRDAYVIKNGGDLVAEPGGGICQSTTTLYRAVLLAGLPVIKRANHSLYVSYYEKHGVGLDATVYAPKQDFVFRNDTPGPIVVSAHAADMHATIDLYGIPDGREVSLNGPFVAATSDNSLSFRDEPLRINQIGWDYAVRYEDGTVKDEPVISTYKAVPKKLREGNVQ